MFIDMKFKDLNSYDRIGEKIRIIHELSTDTLYIEYNGNITVMLDPKTGLPLTHDIWENYYKK